jgi:hypothetical protein
MCSAVLDELEPDNHMDSNQMSDMTKFMLRKDLLFSRLTTFNDKAESYYACKASFKGIMEDLQVSDAEQIDLLVKWHLRHNVRQLVKMFSVLV